MKDKIMFLIIGILIGAIVATSGFLIYSKSVKNNSNQPEKTQMDGKGQMMQSENGNMGEPPEKPDGDNSVAPMAKPEDLNNNTNV